MKISSIRTHVVGEARNFFFVVVETDEGITGIGEGGVTWRESAMTGFIYDVSPSLIGQDPFRTEHLWQVMLRCGFFPPGRIGLGAMSAIDIALWDIKAKALGVPLYQLLGGIVRDRVACYAHIDAPTTKELVANAVAHAEQGWRFVRFNLPESGNILEPRDAVRNGVEQFAAVREGVGDEIEIIIDVHTRLDVADAVTLCRELEPYRPFFVEDPVRSENPASLRRVREQTSVPIGMGEQHATKWEFREMIENDWIDSLRQSSNYYVKSQPLPIFNGFCDTKSSKP